MRSEFDPEDLNLDYFSLSPSFDYLESGPNKAWTEKISRASNSRKKKVAEERKKLRADLKKKADRIAELEQSVSDLNDMVSCLQQELKEAAKTRCNRCSYTFKDMIMNMSYIASGLNEDSFKCLEKVLKLAYDSGVDKDTIESLIKQIVTNINRIQFFNAHCVENVKDSNLKSWSFEESLFRSQCETILKNIGINLDKLKQ